MPNNPATYLIVQMQGTYAVFPPDADVAHVGGALQVSQGGKVYTFGTPPAVSAVPDAPASPVAAPVPAGNTWSFQVGTSGNTGTVGGGILLVTCAGRIVDTIVIGDKPSVHSYSGAQVVPPLSLVYQGEGPGKDAGIGLYIWNGVYQPWKTAWLYHNGMVLADPTPDAAQVIAAPYVPPPVPLTRPSGLDVTLRFAKPLTVITDAPKVFEVGPERTYATPAAAWLAIAADTSNRLPVMRIDPDIVYSGQEQAGPVKGYIYKSVTVESSNPDKLVRLNGGVYGPQNGKSLFTAAGPGIVLTCNNVEFYWCNEPGGGRNNACAITVEDVPGVVVTLNGCIFWGNGNGVGRGDALTTIWNMDGCVFYGNGNGGEGYSHNSYTLGGQLNYTRCHSFDVQQGHLLKSRCLENTVSDSVFDNGPTGTCSYGLDFPDGGVNRVERCRIVTNANSVNSVSIHMGQELAWNWHPVSSLDVIDCEIDSTRAGEVGIRLAPPAETKPGVALPVMPVPHVSGLKVKGLTMVYDDLVGGTLPADAFTVLP